MLMQWKQKQDITNDELYHFLHSIKGTASSIGLIKLTEIASELIEKISKDGQRIWNEEEWGNFIQPLALEFNDTTESSQLEEDIIEERPSQSKILIIDDDIELLNDVKDCLEENNYMVFIATTIDRGVQLFYDHHPDLVIIDYFIKGKSSLEFLSRIATLARSIFTPIIVISDEATTFIQKQVYDSGAHDFIQKPIDNTVFLSIINNRMKQQDWFKKRVMVDELTKTYNRASLYEIWSELNKTYQKTEIPFSFALMDLDHFKQVNDRHGHSVGDLVLTNFSKLILQEKRQKDYLVRYGGEEFLLILPKTKQSEAVGLVDGLLKKFMKLGHDTDEGQIKLSFTAGVAEVQKSIKSMEQLIVRSDLALYFGKQNGRHSVHGYTAEMQKSNEVIERDSLLRIAVVDDDRVIQRLLSDQLSKMSISNYQVEVKSFQDGETFLNSTWYKGTGKYIILLDGIMPKMDGLEVLSHLRKTENEKNMGIVMLTGRQKDKDIVKALELGADDYITKPFSLQQLQARIKRLVNRLF